MSYIHTIEIIKSKLLPNNGEDYKDEFISSLVEDIIKNGITVENIHKYIQWPGIMVDAHGEDDFYKNYEEYINDTISSINLAVNDRINLEKELKRIAVDFYEFKIDLKSKNISILQADQVLNGISVNILETDLIKIFGDDVRYQTFTKDHSSGWTIKGKIVSDHYTWIEEFSATHSLYGKIEKIDDTIYTNSMSGYQHFIKNHPLTDFDTR